MQFPGATSWISIHVFHSLQYVINNGNQWNADIVGLPVTREWNNYAAGFNYYRVNGVKIEFFPVEIETGNVNA